jgi:hypothetical protein
MAYGLTLKIFKHALGDGWIKTGDIVVDPFGGIGSTGIVGAHFGLQVICVELEQKFVDLARQNFELHKKSIEMFSHFGTPLYPVIIQGDSRKLAEIIEGCDCVVSSPPYINQDTNIFVTKNQGKRSCDYTPEEKKARKQGAMGRNGFRNLANATPGQLGSMKPGQLAPILSGGVEAIISSPPYVSGGHHPDQTGAWGGKLLNKGKGPKGLGSKEMASYNRDNPKNLGNLKSGDVGAIISSPPYEGSNTGQKPGTGEDVAKRRYERLKKAGYDADALMTPGRRKHNLGTLEHYGKSEGQLGNEQGQTFWEAARIIVEQCHQILKPGGYAIWIVKAFVRKGKKVDFPGDWQKLCESVGFETLHEHHAMLFKPEATGVFDFAKEGRKERHSFFRRNAHNKGAWRNYWNKLPARVQRRWLSKTAKRTNIFKYKKLLVKAQETIFKSMGEVPWEWNEDIRIDYEVIFCTRKP